MIRFGTFVVFVAGASAPGPSPADGAIRPLMASGAAPGTAVIEQCDGSRSAKETAVAPSQCHQWRIEWRSGGKVWGVVSAPNREALVAERDRILGFQRQYARFFDVAFDERYRDPSAVICHACKPSQSVNSPGPSPSAGGGAIDKALSNANAQMIAVQSSLTLEHLPRLRDVARLSRTKRSGRAAKQYAKDMRAAVGDLARAQLVLDNAAVFRSKSEVQKANKTLETRAKALKKDYAALSSTVAKEIKATIGGRFPEDEAVAETMRTGYRLGPKATVGLLVDIKGADVALTYNVGEHTRPWFRGQVQLDGTVTGRSQIRDPSAKKQVWKCSESDPANCAWAEPLIDVPAALLWTETEAGDEAKGKGKGKGKGKAKSKKRRLVLDLKVQVDRKWSTLRSFSR